MPDNPRYTVSFLYRARRSADVGKEVRHPAIDEHLHRIEEAGLSWPLQSDVNDGAPVLKPFFWRPSCGKD